MDVSVVICTYNRDYQLKNVLQSLFNQAVPESLDWEIIVVDNNSSDNTADVVKKFSVNSCVPLLYVKEEKQGLSYARNRGIMSSKGKYIAFIDDDALAGSNWVAGLYETFRKYKCDGVGGRIYLKTAKPLPKWLTSELRGFLAYLDYGNQPFQITDNHFLYGTNMAFSRETFSKIGCFNIELGRSGYIPSGGEEIDLINRILKNRGCIYYQPSAEVYHVIEEYKLQKKYFRRLHYHEGFSKGVSYNGDVKRHLYGIPLFIFPQVIRSIMKYLRNPSLRMQMNIWWFLGFIRGRGLERRQSN